MTRRRAFQLVLLAAGLAGCGSQRLPASARHLPPEVATPPASPGLLRISRTNGTAQLLNPGTLAVRQTLIPGGIPAIGRVLGTSSADEQTVFAADNGGRLIAIDLAARRARVIPTSARQLIASPDGIILGIDSARHPVRITNRQLITYRPALEQHAIVLRGPGDQVTVAENRPGELQLFNATTETHHATVPVGHVGTTWTGDLVTITTDSGVMFIDPTGKLTSRFVRIRGTPTAAAFSPSGHRLYVARKTGGLVMVDRFLVMSDRQRRSQVRELTVSGDARALRVDRTGRWLLEESSEGDSVRVIDLTATPPALAASEAAPWDSDLPQVVDEKTLLLRHKADLVAVDLGGASPSRHVVLTGGAADLYVMLPWAPRGQASQSSNVAAAPTPPPVAAGDSGRQPAAGTTSSSRPASTAPGTAIEPEGTAPVAPEAAGKTAAGDTTAKVYLQVSSSQNAEWAQAFAKQLKDGGFPAKVLDPRTSDEGYRVVVGPYRTREEADAVGKRLGRSYFIVNPGSGDT